MSRDVAPRPATNSELMLDALARVQESTQAHRELLHDLRGIIREAPARLEREALSTDEPVKTVDAAGGTESVAVLNFSGSTVQLGIAGRSANAGNGLPLPPHTYLVLPVRTNFIDVGADPNDLAANGPADVVVLLFDKPQQLAAGGIPLVAGANVVDVADRAGRLVGHVTVDALPAGGIDVTDRAGRLLGHIAAIDSAVDVSDRAARLLGHVAAIDSPVDVSDRAARLLGHVAAIDSAVDVSDRAARLLGLVDRVRPATATTTSVAASATSVVLLVANANRKGATVYNDSTAVCYLKLGAGASTISHAVQIAGGGYYELPYDYTGEVDAVWAAATGNARITEVTP